MNESKYLKADDVAKLMRENAKKLVAIVSSSLQNEMGPVIGMIAKGNVSALPEPRKILAMIDKCEELSRGKVFEMVERDVQKQLASALTAEQIVDLYRAENDDGEHAAEGHTENEILTGAKAKEGEG